MVSPCSVPEPQTVLNPLNSAGIVTAGDHHRAVRARYEPRKSTAAAWGPHRYRSPRNPTASRPSSKASRRRVRAQPAIPSQVDCRSALALKQRSQPAAQLDDVGARQLRFRYAADIVLTKNGRLQHVFQGSIGGSPKRLEGPRLTKRFPAIKKRSGQSAIVGDADARRDADFERFAGSGGACSVSGPRVKSAPLWRSVMPSARVSLPGPLARSSMRSTGRRRAAFPRFRRAAPTARIRTQPGAAFRLGHDVQAIVNAVDQVDVSVAGRTEDNLGARRAARAQHATPRRSGPDKLRFRRCARRRRACTRTLPSSARATSMAGRVIEASRQDGAPRQDGFGLGPI